MNRRDFVKSGALLSTSLIFPYHVTRKTSKIKIAIVGTGWWGTDVLLPNLLATANFEVIGLCDVDSIALERASNELVKAGENRPVLFSDYRELYKLSGLQAVVISTPTHWHALQFIDACKAGLHVFLEKPISYDIREGQVMVEAQRKANNVVLVDFPRVMVDTNDQIKAFIKSGGAGKILQAQANINNNEGVLFEKSIPETIDFERFCGPAPITKYLCSKDGTKPGWRGQHDFSRGLMMDWGIHYIHNIRKIMELDMPDHVASIGGFAGNIPVENPNYLDVKFDFGGLPVNWSHKSWGYTASNPDHNIGLYLFGEKGTIFSGDLGWEFYPKGGNEKIVHGDVRFRPGAAENIDVYNKMFADMFKEFAEGIRNNSNKGITNTLQDAFKSTSTVIYGDISFLVKSGINIDKASMNINNNDKAQGMLKRDYQNGYKHPYTT
jgi:predicted dehydrogenase